MTKKSVSLGPNATFTNVFFPLNRVALTKGQKETVASGCDWAGQKQSRGRGQDQTSCHSLSDNQ